MRHQGLPSSLLLENSEKDRFLLLPSATLPGRPESKVEGCLISAKIRMNKEEKQNKAKWLSCVAAMPSHAYAFGTVAFGALFLFMNP